MNAKETLEKNGFDFEVFEIENEHSAKNLLLAMKEYAKLYAIECCEIQRVICAENAETETDTSTSYVYTSVNKNSIIGAPLPECLNEQK